jgi:hypothetical protein
VKKKKVKGKEFPKQIILIRQEEDSGYWFSVADDDLSGDDGRMVGVYELVEIKEVKVSVALL